MATNSAAPLAQQISSLLLGKTKKRTACGRSPKKGITDNLASRDRPVLPQQAHDRVNKFPFRPLPQI